MSDGSRAAAGLRERLTTGTEDKLGKALADLFENPLITGTIGRAFDARERAAQAQELALSALNIPTAADIERLTRRLRSVSQRLEGIEDGVHRLNRALTEGSVERRLASMEEQLKALSVKLSGEAPKKPEPKPAAQKRATPKRATRATRPKKSA
jgi:CRP-like cAMP-binding protein